MDMSHHTHPQRRAPHLMLEELEPRMLLSTTWTGTYADGSPLEIKLSGPGTLAVTGGVHSVIDTITVNSLRASDVLTISAQTANPSTTIQVNRIDVTGPLKAINAPQVDLKGDATDHGLVSPNWMGSLSLHTVDFNTSIEIGPTGVPLTSPIRISLKGTLFNSSVVLSSPIASFTAQSASGSISSESDIKNIKVVDSLVAGITAAGKIGTIKAGGTGGGTWQAAGNIGKVQLGSAITTLRLSTPGDIESVSTTGDANFYDITARNLGSLTVGGNMQMQSVVRLSGTEPDAVCLKKVTVNGWWSSGFIRAHGSVGTVTAGGIGSARIFAGVLDSYPNYMGNNQASGTLENVNGSLSTATIKKIIVTGKAHDPGNSSDPTGVKMVNIAAASLPYIRLAHTDFSLAPDHAITAVHLGNISATGTDGTVYTYGENWPTGHLLVVPLI